MKKCKLTFIDIGIILLLIVAAAVCFVIFKPMNAVQTEKKDVYFTVMGTEAEAGIGDKITVGDVVSISFSEEAYATVVDVSEEPYKEDIYSVERGSYVSHEIEGKSNIRVLLRCSATVTDTDMMNGNVAIKVGNEMPVKGKGYTVKGYVIEAEDR